MSIDIVDQIDALIDEQLSEGEPIGGFDYDDPDYPKCWHCGDDWHGLPITERVREMRVNYCDCGCMSDELDSYRAGEDDSPVWCPGSTFIGPMPRPLGYGDGAPMFTRQAVHVTLWDESWNRIVTATQQQLAVSFADAIERFAAWTFKELDFTFFIRENDCDLPQNDQQSQGLDRSDLDFAGASDVLNSNPGPVIQDLGESIRRFGGSVRRANSTVPMWAHDPTRSRRTRNR